jgi:glutamyl/glutaminyl-tRNA synthetase
LIQQGLIEPGFKDSQFPPAYGGREIIQTYKISKTKQEILFNTLSKIVSIYQERLKKLSEITELVDFFFKEKIEFDKSLLKWNEMSDKELKASLDRSVKVLSGIKDEDFNIAKLTDVLLQEAEKFGKKIKGAGDRGYLLWPLRVALTGKKSSASPFEIAEILKKEKTLKRLEQAKALIK